jgi:hypothetical protein
VGELGFDSAFGVRALVQVEHGGADAVVAESRVAGEA